MNVFPTKVLPRLSPATWALTIELLFYLLIAIGLSKTKWLALFWLSMSVMYMAATHMLNLSHEYRQSIILAGSLPFALGASLYHFREPLCSMLHEIARPLPIAILFSLFLMNSLFGAVTKNLSSHELGFYLSFYLNYLINALLVTSLIRGCPPMVRRKTDQTIGDFSYPIYLMHWQVGFFSSMVIWGEPIRGLNTKGLVSCALTVMICFIVSWLVIKYIDSPIQRLRAGIKYKASKRLNTGFAANAAAPVS
jgi:peptidoglycan/LPS O-acetylase OafA/YrhL